MASPPMPTSSDVYHSGKTKREAAIASFAGVATDAAEGVATVDAIERDSPGDDALGATGAARGSIAAEGRAVALVGRGIAAGASVGMAAPVGRAASFG